MPTFHVKVKWGKEVYPDVEIDTTEPPMVFKAQLFALTGVEPHRQKVMLKGGAALKEDSWDGTKIKDGTMIFMMGSKEEDVPQEPVQRTAFIEDMSEAELSSALDLPVGIKNLGNTCYLNSVVQCFKSVPVLHEAIQEFKPKLRGHEMDSNAILTESIQDCYRSMNTGQTAVPLLFVSLFRSTFPRFAEQGENGVFMQQDASECWTELMRLLQGELPAGDASKTAPKFAGSLVDQYFSGEFHCEWNCVEDENDKNITYDKFQQLSCHINQDVKYLHTGLLARMKEQITKRSAALDRDAVYSKNSTISRLPAYLTVEMVRFFYKEREAVNAKVLKDVKFPLMLDLFDLCSPELQQKLIPVRTQYKAMEEREMEVTHAKNRGTPLENQPVTKALPFSFEDDLGSSNSGYYQLQAVLTHQGRSSSSGHYVAWVKWRGTDWVKCDDDIISAVSEEDILKLSGGGDWHCSYLLLYGPRILEVLEEDPEKPADEMDMA